MEGSPLTVSPCQDLEDEESRKRTERGKKFLEMAQKWANSIPTLIISHKLLNSYPKTRIETKQRKWHNEGNSRESLELDRAGSSGDHEKGSALGF